MIFSLLPTNKPLVGTVNQLVKLLRINVTQKTIEETVLSHPDYPSMLVVSDCLREWKVENAALRLSPDVIAEIPTPFVTFISNDFKIITAISDHKVWYLDEDGRPQYFERSFFVESWGGVVLLAESNDLAGEKQYKTKKTVENAQLWLTPTLLFMAIVATTGVVALFSANRATALSYAFGGLLVCKLLGIVVASLLLWYEIDKYNPALQKICGNSGKKTNCEAILNSNQSKVFAWLSWSEVGFFYFMGGFLSLLLFSETINLMAWLNVLALPYILFSIGYQAFVAKEWCPLCLTVQALLFMEFTFAFSGNLYSYPYSLNQANFMSAAFLMSIGKNILLFLLPVLVWYFFKPQLQGANEGKNHKYELARLKNSVEIFNAILNKQDGLVQSAHGLGVMIGNPSATNTIIKVCNPYCSPCSEAHQELEKLLSGNVKVQIIYNASNYDFDITQHPAKHFLAISEQADRNQLLQVLHDWYADKNKDYEAFAVKHPVNGELEAQSVKIEAMYEWCNANSITHTPTYFYNGRRLPSLYKLGDLEHFLS